MECMKEALRQTAIVGISCLITLIIWVGVRVLMARVNLQFSTLVNYLLVILLYTAIRLGIKNVWQTKSI